tara:strand:+ start:197 stop:454 length:258 start_codon:yes stop_codon:yes gene_type:complete
LLSKIQLNFGVALGLFAIFAILRFRTETIRVKEMTYFFVIIGVSAINALANDKASIIELSIANSTIIILLFFLEFTISRSSSEKE